MRKIMTLIILNVIIHNIISVMGAILNDYKVLNRLNKKNKHYFDCGQPKMEIIK